MTKSLTEQWHDGKLKRGCYFIKLYGETELVACYNDICDTFHTDIGTYTTSVKEVLAPVPSYDKVKEMSQKIERLELDNEALEMALNEGKEINAELVSKTEQLEKQLEIATKALKETKDSLLKIELSNLNYEERHKLYDIMFADGVIDRALLEMEGVK